MVELANLEIDQRYNGPEGSGNGGVSAGMLAQRLGHDALVRVRLRQPPPLATQLRLEQDGSHVRAFDGTALVLEAEKLEAEKLEGEKLEGEKLEGEEARGGAPATPALAVVEPVSFAQAVAAAGRYDGLSSHPFPTCFVCGTARRDGLAIYAGAIDPADPMRVAAPFHAPAGSGLSGQVLVWAALDCPGGWAIGLVGRHAVLGTMTAQVFDVPTVDEQCVIVAHCQGWEGRKAYSRSSLYGADDRLLGTAEQVWIELKRE